MSQSTLDDDDLFGEAASEMRADVEESLSAAREELPDADSIWKTEAENVLGVLNGLKSALDVGEAADRLREAKKWFVIGQRADAFEDASDLEEEIEEVEALIGEIESARESVSELTSTVPGLKGSLEEAEAGGGTEDDAEETDDEGQAAEADD
ncbi:DUF5790 family protein [Natronorarus salvus]|uniref:DUF5790 family protein n=1 Tax=Natronorarus salvus TaxID=3117733 RepID=UPI002F263368